jgi:hypothetical protein
MLIDRLRALLRRAAGEQDRHAAFRRELARDRKADALCAAGDDGLGVLVACVRIEHGAFAHNDVARSHAPLVMPLPDPTGSRSGNSRRTSPSTCLL